MTAVDGMKQLAKPWYSDQILPFDITLAGASELGAATAMKIFGVEILNEGSGVSIDDAVTEMQATFVARLGASRRNEIFVSSRARGRSIVVDRRGQPWAFSSLESYGRRWLQMFVTQWLRRVETGWKVCG
jgi:hypothetical protein